MTEQRKFSDSTKLKATIRNIKKYGQLTCEICKKNINPKEMHYDHIIAWINGGRSVLDNCQILCNGCNEKKSDKLLEDFKIEQNAKDIVDTSKLPSTTCEHILSDKIEGKITKEMATKMIVDFYNVHKNIRHRDFLRHNVSPPLPSIHWMEVYWGYVTKMKEQLNLNPRHYWTMEDSLNAFKKWINEHGTINMKDLGSKNNLPSQTLMRKYFGLLSNLKRELNLENKPSWKNIDDIEAAVEAYVKKKGIREITAEELVSKNGLPGYPVIHREYGSMAEFQKRNNLIVKQTSITKNDIEDRLRNKFGDNKRVFNNKRELFSTIKTTEDTIIRMYGDFDSFLREARIELDRRRYKGDKGRYKWTKKEIEDITWKFIQKNGVRIPKESELTKLGLPSDNTYSRYWQNYKVAFKYIINKNL